MTTDWNTALSNVQDDADGMGAFTNKMHKKKELYKAILLLPGTVLILIPAVILVLFNHVCWFCGKPFPESMFVVGAAFLLACVGVFVAIWTVMLFYTRGNGTPAPWAPPMHLIVNGPYSYVRNPMLMAVHSILLAEALVFGSIGILSWTGIFWVLNTLYFSFIEEPELKLRFGGEYEEYSRNVARWVPRMTPWIPPIRD